MKIKVLVKLTLKKNGTYILVVNQNLLIDIRKHF